VVLKIGAAGAVDNVPATDHKGDRHYKYKSRNGAARVN